MFPLLDVGVVLHKNHRGGAQGCTLLSSSSLQWVNYEQILFQIFGHQAANDEYLATLAHTLECGSPTAQGDLRYRHLLRALELENFPNQLQDSLRAGSTVIAGWALPCCHSTRSLIDHGERLTFATERQHLVQLLAVPRFTSFGPHVLLSSRTKLVGPSDLHIHFLHPPRARGSFP